MKSSDFEKGWGLDVAERGRQKKQKENPSLLSNSSPKTT